MLIILIISLVFIAIFLKKINDNKKYIICWKSKENGKVFKSENLYTLIEVKRLTKDLNKIQNQYTYFYEKI